MNAGELRHEIVLQQLATGQDTFGAPSGTWTTVATRQASIEPLTGRELFSAQQVNAQVDHRIRLRYLAGVTPRMRVLFGARVFDILFVRNLEERNVELELLAQEVA